MLANRIRFGSTANSIIRSIQQITVTIGSLSATGTATITSVSTANSMLIYEGFTATSTGDPGSSVGTTTYPYVELTNATTVTATRGLLDIDTVTVYCTVVEFISGVITNKRTGTISTSISTGTDTITSVDTSRSVCFLQGFTGGNSSPQSVLFTVALTDATTVSVARGSSPGFSSVVAYQVIEFSSTYVNSVQARSYSLGDNTSENDTITSVSTANSLIAYGGVKIIGAGTLAQTLYTIRLAGSTTVTLENDTSVSTPKVANYTVLEFKSGYIKSIQRDRSTVTAASIDATITSVSTSKSYSNLIGFSTNGAVSDSSKYFTATKLQSSTAHRSLLNTSVSPSTITTSWEVVEFY